MTMTRAFAAPTKAFRPARSARVAVVARAATRSLTKPAKKTVKSVEQVGVLQAAAHRCWLWALRFTAPAQQPSPGTQADPSHLLLLQTSAKRPVFELGFTASNELFVGRLAMLGFASSLIGGAGPALVLGWRNAACLCSGISYSTLPYYAACCHTVCFNMVALLLAPSDAAVAHSNQIPLQSH